MALFAMLSGFWLAFHLNAAFDVYFEGPMGGIWFWTVFGTALAAIHIHRTQPEVLDGIQLGDPETTRPLAPTWGWHGAPEASGGRAGTPRRRVDAPAPGSWGTPIPARGDGQTGDAPAVPTWTPVR